MDAVSSVPLRIAGSVVGLFIGWLALGLLCYQLVYRATNGWESEHGVTALLAAIPSFLVGAPLGAAVGATIAQRVLRRKSSFWRALLGSVTGLVAGIVMGAGLLLLSNSLGMDWWQQNTEILIVPTIATAAVIGGAVMGSGWKAKPADPGTKKGVPPALS